MGGAPQEARMAAEQQRLVREGLLPMLTALFARHWVAAQLGDGGLDEARQAAVAAVRKLALAAAENAQRDTLAAACEMCLRCSGLEVCAQT
jgi:hypothetical protein